MLGAEMTKMDDWTLSLLTNQKVLALLPPSCRPRQICLNEDKAVWTACDEKEGTLYTALFNLSDETASVSVGLDDLGKGFEEDAALTDLWDGAISRSEDLEIRAILPAHGCVLYQVHIK